MFQARTLAMPGHASVPARDNTTRPSTAQEDVSPGGGASTQEEASPESEETLDIREEFKRYLEEMENHASESKVQGTVDLVPQIKEHGKTCLESSSDDALDNILEKLDQLTSLEDQAKTLQKFSLLSTFTPEVPKPVLKPSRHTGEDESLLVKMTVVVSALAAGYVGAMLACGHSGLLCAQWDMLCALWLGAFNKVFRWLFPLTQVMVRHQTLHSSAIASAMEGSLGCVSQCESICGAYLSTQFGPINLRARAR